MRFPKSILALEMEVWNVRRESSTDLTTSKSNFRSAPESGLRAEIASGPFRADFVAKVFLGWRTNFLGPLMRYERDDVRDHIVCRKNDYETSYALYGVSQRWKSPKSKSRLVFVPARSSGFYLHQAALPMRLQYC
jgi:hypothetical protein